MLPYMIIVQHTTVSEALFSGIANWWALVLFINKGWGHEGILQKSHFTEDAEEGTLLRTDGGILL